MFVKNLISIDLGNENIKIVVGSSKGNALKIIDYATIETPSNTYENGEITDLDKLRGVIRRKLDEMSVKQRLKAILSLDSAEVITRELELPYSKDIDLNSIVKFELEDTLPVMLDDYIVESKILETFDEGAVKKYRILAALMPKRIGDQLHKLIMGLNLEPYVLDINSNIMSKIISAAYKVGKWNLGEFGTIAALDIGANTTSVIIFDKTIMKLSKLIELGTIDAITGISNTFGLSFQEAKEKMISDVDLNIEESGDASANLLSDVAKDSLEKLCDQIQMILKFYMSRETTKEFDGLLLYGGASRIKGMKKYMEDYFKIPIIEIDVKSHVSLPVKSEEIDTKLYANALGALLGR